MRYIIYIIIVVYINYMNCNIYNLNTIKYNKLDDDEIKERIIEGLCGYRP